jgi:hypothetical protein
VGLCLSVVELMLSMHKSLSLIPSTQTKEVVVKRGQSSEWVVPATLHQF